MAVRMRRLSLDAGGGGCRPGVVTVFQMFRKGGTIYAGPAAQSGWIKRSRWVDGESLPFAHPCPTSTCA